VPGQAGVEGKGVLTVDKERGGRDELAALEEDGARGCPAERYTAMALKGSAWASTWEEP